jgi:hypothetical protein
MEPEGSLPCSQDSANSKALRNISQQKVRSCQAITPCRLSATAYSIYSQLPSTSGDRPLHLQSGDAPSWSARDPHNTEND